MRAFCSAAMSSERSVITSPFTAMDAASHGKPEAAVGYTPAVWSTKYASNPAFLISPMLIERVSWCTMAPIISRWPSSSVPREASEMFQCIKYEDKREVFGLKIHSFSTLDRIKKYDDSDNEKNAEKPYSIKVGETKRTINLYAIATTKFQIAV